MKKTGLLILLLAAGAWAQDAANATAEVSEGLAPTSASFPTERVQTPTYADLYCAGFISKQILPDARFVGGGLQTPTTTKFVRGDMIYLMERATPRARSTRLCARCGTSMSTKCIPAGGS